MSEIFEFLVQFGTGLAVLAAGLVVIVVFFVIVAVASAWADDHHKVVERTKTRVYVVGALAALAWFCYALGGAVLR